MEIVGVEDVGREEEWLERFMLEDRLVLEC